MERDMKTHVTVLGWLYVLGNAIFLVLGITGFLFLAGLGVLSGDAEAVKVLGFIGGVGAIFFAVLALPGLAAGFGLMAGKSWARVLALVVGFLGLANFPLGTAIGIYAFWVLLQHDADEYFATLKPA
jgi:hypothetical protein